MIHFICGRPRGGKTLYTVGLIIKELAEGRRVVITNAPLKLGAINQYLQDRYPERDCDMRYRVQLLDDATETGKFYLLRPWGYRVVDVSKAEEKEGKRLDFGRLVRADRSYDLKWYVHKSRVVKMSDGALEPAQLCLPLNDPEPGADWVKCNEPATLQASALPGVYMVIDELHNFFGARDWADVGKGCLFYLSQHAKLGDTLLCVTQNEKNVDRQFRSVAQDFSYIRNYGKEKLGFFRKPSILLRSTYMSPSGTPNNEALEIKTVKLDTAGICQLYDTAAGVGIVGSDADKGERAKGLNPSWVVVGLVVLVLMVWFSGDALASVFNRAVVGPKPSTVAVRTNGGAPVSVPGAKPLPPVPPMPERSLKVVAETIAPAAKPYVDSTNIFLTGWTVNSGVTNFLLSDGGMIISSPSVKAGATWVMVGGVRFTNVPRYTSTADARAAARDFADGR